MKIEKGIPYAGPARGKGHGAASPKYPFADCEVGDSFLVPWPDGETEESAKKHQTRLTVASHRQRPKVFANKICREEGGVRVWRIE